MNDREFDELAGRIDGVARLVLHVVALLEDNGVIDGSSFSGSLRKSVRLREDSSQLLQTALVTVQELADQLDSARNYRRERAHIMENQDH